MRPELSFKMIMYMNMDLHKNITDEIKRRLCVFFVGWGEERGDVGSMVKL